MTRRLILLTSLLALSATACTTTNVVLPFTNTDQYKSAADAAKSDLSYIAPTDPRYSENGAPRAGEPTGASIAGDPRLVGEGMSYAPLSHKRR
ncbi:MAG: hypothetical protein HY060_03620 [Proteobacteria bacterium]|nr:hypothetical protein [Pseudomonadota bacterium]